MSGFIKKERKNTSRFTKKEREKIRQGSQAEKNTEDIDDNDHHNIVGG